MQWSTKAIEADRPFGSWAEDLADAFVQLEPRENRRATFPGDNLARRRRVDPDFARRCDQARGSPVALAHRAKPWRCLFCQSPARRRWPLHPARPRAGLRAGRPCYRRYHRAIRNRELPEFQLVLLCGAAATIAEGSRRAAAVEAFGDRGRPRAIPDTRRTCGSLPSFGAEFGNRDLRRPACR